MLTKQDYEEGKKFHEEITSWGNTIPYDEDSFALQAKRFRETEKENIVSTPNKENQSNTYSFRAQREDVDIVRIVREAPVKTPFIVIEIKKKGIEKEILLLVHNDVIKNIPNLNVLGYALDSAYWRSEPPQVPTLYSYKGRWVYSDRDVFKEVQKIKDALNPKDTRVKVSLL